MLCHEGLLVLAGAHVVSGAADPQAVYVHAQIHDKEFWPQKNCATDAGCPELLVPCLYCCLANLHAHVNCHCKKVLDWIDSLLEPLQKPEQWSAGALDEEHAGRLHVWH